MGRVSLGLPLMAMAMMGNAAPQDLRAQRQAMLGHLLTVTASKNIARDRVDCLSGRAAKSIPRARLLGSQALPDVADYCVTVLIRSARDGIRSLLRDASSTAPTSASALDHGFMVAYAKNEPLPAGLPTMATLRPIAQRCLSLAESDVELCYAVGSAYGRRARLGETVTIP